MGKFSIVIAIAIAFIGPALAFTGKIGLEEEIFEPGLHHGIGGGIGRGHLGHLRDEELFEELRLRGHGGFGGFGGFGGPGRFGKGRFGARRGRPFLGLGGGGLGGGGLGGVGGGAIGGAEASRGNLDAVGSSSHLGTHNLAEGAQGSIVGSKKDFDAGGHLDVINENEGVHRHNVINSNKLVIKDSTTGVSDEDSFRKVNGISKGGHVSGSKAGVVAEASGNRLENDREADHAFGGVHASEAEAAAGGAEAGGAGGVGGIF